MENNRHLYLIALNLMAGVMHFFRPRRYQRIIQGYSPSPRVYESGATEIVLGMGLLFVGTRPWSIYGIISILLIFLLVHFNLLTSQKAGAGISRWAFLLRISLHILLMGWAGNYLQF